MPPGIFEEKSKSIFPTDDDVWTRKKGKSDVCSRLSSTSRRRTVGPRHLARPLGRDKQSPGRRNGAIRQGARHAAPARGDRLHWPRLEGGTRGPHLRQGLRDRRARGPRQPGALSGARTPAAAPCASSGLLGRPAPPRLIADNRGPPALSPPSLTPAHGSDSGMARRRPEVALPGQRDGRGGGRRPRGGARGGDVQGAQPARAAGACKAS